MLVEGKRVPDGEYDELAAAQVGKGGERGAEADDPLDLAIESRAGGEQCGAKRQRQAQKLMQGMAIHPRRWGQAAARRSTAPQTDQQVQRLVHGTAPVPTKVSSDCPKEMQPVAPLR